MRANTQMKKPLFFAGIALAVLIPILAVADVGPPAHMPNESLYEGLVGGYEIEIDEEALQRAALRVGSSAG